MTSARSVGAWSPVPHLSSAHLLSEALGSITALVWDGGSGSRPLKCPLLLLVGLGRISSALHLGCSDVLHCTWLSPPQFLSER